MTLVNDGACPNVTCPTCGQCGLRVEHRYLVAVDLDLAGPTGQLGCVCPILVLSDQGEVDQHGEIVWRTVGHVLGVRSGAATLDDGVAVTAEGRTVVAHNAEVHSSTIRLRCECGWSQSEESAPTDGSALFERLRTLASLYVDSDPIRKSVPVS